MPFRPFEAEVFVDLGPESSQTNPPEEDNVHNAGFARETEEDNDDESTQPGV